MPKYTLDNYSAEHRKYKVIALDLDDTLLKDDKTISQRNKTALKKALNQGFSIAITTGRHPYSALFYMKELGCLNENSYAVVFNGAAVIRFSDYISFNNPIGFPSVACTTLSGTLARKISEIAHQFGCRVHGYSVQRGLVLEDLNPHSLREVTSSMLDYKLVDFSECSDDEDFFKMLAVGKEEELTVLRNSIHAELNSMFSIVKSDPNFLEFIPEHSTKGTGLAALCRSIGCSIDNAIAFGDAENDLDMIRKAGLGVAMKNGFEIVKENADLVTLTNEEDGVAVVVEKFLR